MSVATLSLDNPTFSKFAFYAAVVLGKTALMSAWTARYRIPRKVFSTPEDYTAFGKKSSTVTTTDPDIERVRRCHQNDIENVPIFVLVGLLFVLVKPDHSYAVTLFRTFAASRLLHTIVYMNAVPPPTRTLCFVVGQTVIGLMLTQIFTSASF